MSLNGHPSYMSLNGHLSYMNLNGPNRISLERHNAVGSAWMESSQATVRDWGIRQQTFDFDVHATAGRRNIWR
jgi:hypothetical protein